MLTSAIVLDFQRDKAYGSVIYGYPLRRLAFYCNLSYVCGVNIDLLYIIFHFILLGVKLLKRVIFTIAFKMAAES